MDDIEIKKTLEVALEKIDWKKELTDQYMWEFEYTPMFAKIEFPKKNLTFGNNMIECWHNKLNERFIEII